ncbi:uncharacterized protein [Pocillopora verrucosa]|uniref:uncharacterized protein n=1 Tax=Pocillopora verrucosa TaxID=203993 RepID=UPI0033413CDA
MACLKEIATFLFLGFLLDFSRARYNDKQLTAFGTDQNIDRTQESLILNSWMESERVTFGRSKRQIKSKKRTSRYRLPYFPLYPIDLPECKDKEREAKSGMCKSWAKSDFCKKAKSVMETYCPKECGFCKQFSPPGCQSRKHGCCWNNLRARGPNGQGCPVCQDSYRRLCKLFGHLCSQKGTSGKFVRYHCFQTCGWCDKVAQLRAKESTGAV